MTKDGLHADDSALVEPILDRHRRGLAVPVADLLTDDDFAVVAEERDRTAGWTSASWLAWQR